MVSSLFMNSSSEDNKQTKHRDHHNQYNEMPESARAVLAMLATKSLEVCKVKSNHIIGSQETLFNEAKLRLFYKI